MKWSTKGISILQGIVNNLVVPLPNGDEINSIEDKNTSTGEKWLYKSLSFYGGHIIENKGGFKISLDGACGFSSIEQIANEIGIFLQWNTASNKDKNKTYYLAKIED